MDQHRGGGRRTVGIGKPPFAPEQVRALMRLVEERGHRCVDLQDGGMGARALIGDCDAVIGHVDADLLRAAGRLLWLQVAPAGVERYVQPGVLPEGAVVTNGSGAYGIAISEYMIGGLLMLQRRMAQYLDNQRRHEWKQYPGIRTLYGSRVTVVGVGDLGTNFAERCRAMGAAVTGVRRSGGRPAPACYERVVLADALDEAIAGADVVALCLPQTGETARLFDAARIARMKPGAILINVGRGGAVDADALVAALEAGAVGGALLDVFDPEPLPADHPLWDAPNAILTPHISGIDRDRLAAGRVYDIFEGNLRRFLDGEPLLNVVDAARGY